MHTIQINKPVHYFIEGTYFTELPDNYRFVFGSNLAGIHGRGAAKVAKDHFGAVYGKGVGNRGHSYAIPTKDNELRILPLSEIERYVNDFLAYASTMKHLRFIVTPIGTGEARYKHSDIAPLFKDLPVNCAVTESWTPFIPHGSLYRVF